MNIVTDLDQLREPCNEVGNISNAMKVANKIRDYLLGNEALGLAANQLGYQFTIFGIKLKRKGFRKRVDILINPIAVEERGELIHKEACLSLPGRIIRVKRYTSLRVTYCDSNLKGGSRIYTGLEAAVVQHEMDHLNGILIIDREVQ